HRRLIECEAPAGRLWVGRDQQRAATLGPVHRPDIEGSVLVEPLDAVGYQAEPGIGRYHRIEGHGPGGLVHPRAMQVDVRDDSLERARAVEHRRAEPRRAGARPHQPHLAPVPFVREEGPRLRWRGREDHERRRCYFASAARMRAQLRMPLWNETRSYFSLGEWMRSSSSPKPISNVSMPSSRLKSATMGIDAPEPINAASLPHSCVRARRAAPNAGIDQASETGGAPAWLMNSALQSAGRRARTKSRNASRILPGS